MAAIYAKLSNCQMVNGELLVPSFRMALLFWEFLRRYNEWRRVKRREGLALILVVLNGLLTLLFPVVAPVHGIYITIGLVILFFFTIRNYLNSYHYANHVYVNVHILYHHLLGKLDVGFCDHTDASCDCAEKFRRFVLNHYHISLYGGPLHVG